MKPKEYLQKLRKLNVTIDQKVKELDDLKKTLTTIGSFDYSKDRVQSSASGDPPFVKTLMKIYDLESEIDAEIDKLVDDKHQIINQIHELPNPKHIDILYKHYVEFKRLEIVAVEMNFTYQYIVELHGDALKEFQRIHNDLLNSNDRF